LATSALREQNLIINKEILMKLTNTVNGLLLSAAVIVTLGASSAMAADGKALYTEKLCVTCHGAEGKAPIIPTYPKLAGQNKEYLIAQTTMIKEGVRTGGMTAAMMPLVAAVTAEEIEAISEYLSSVE
jgi:cytochrome c